MEEQLIQASKLATLGTMAAGIAHEMSQPLNIIRLWAEDGLAALRHDSGKPGHQAWILNLVIEQTRRMGAIIDHMRSFSRRDA